VWNLQPWYIVGGAVALVVQAGLIVGLLVNRAQRRRAQRELAERLRFETLVSDLSAAFISARDVPQHIERALERIVHELGLDRAVLAELGQAHDDIIWAPIRGPETASIRSWEPSRGERTPGSPRACRTASRQPVPARRAPEHGPDDRETWPPRALDRSSPSR